MKWGGVVSFYASEHAMRAERVLQRSELPGMLGCEPKGNNHFRTRDKQRTCTPGLFLAGDADGDVQFVIVAAAEGARAATAINRELQDEDRGETRIPKPVGANRGRRLGTG